MDILDNIDTKILAELRKQGRLTIVDLAKRVGVSKTPCLNRVRRLERDGYILGYGAWVNHSKLGTGHIAFVQVTLDDTKTAALNAFNDAVMALAEVEECHMIAGGFDYLLKVRTGDIAAYRRILGEAISALPHVTQTSTFVAMECVKEAGHLEK